MSSVIAAFSAEQVAQLTGLSLDQLREWDNDGFFVPSLALKNRRSPLSRIYTFEDVVGLRTLSLLRKTYKVSRQHLKRAAETLKRHSGKPWSALTIYVLNREVHFKNPETGNIEGAISGQYVVPIELASIADDMRAAADKLKIRDPSKHGHIDHKRYTMNGVPVVAGTRIPVSSVKSFHDAGYTFEEIVDQYPSLTVEDIRAALAYDKLTHAA